MSSRPWIVTFLAAAIASAALTAAAPQGGAAALKNPAALKEAAPATFKANFDTSVGPFVVEVHRDWAPQGADRFYNLVKNGFYDGTRFFRVISGFMVQFGIHGDPGISAAWRSARIPDDPVKQSNKRGYITFAHAGPGTRTTQVFINFADNGSLDNQGFPPFGQVTTGMYKNRGGNNFEDDTIGSGLAVNTKYLGWGTAFLDFDNDGWKDLIVANGHVYPEVDTGHTAEKFKQPRLLYWNRGDGQFFDLSAQGGPGITDGHSSRGLAVGDLDNDGSEEVVIGNMGCALRTQVFVV